MNNLDKKFTDLIGDAYKKYLEGGDIKWLKQMEVDTPAGKMNIPIPYSKEEFINKIKTDDEFAKKWGVEVEVRELSLLERYELMKKLDSWVSVHYKEPKTMEYMDSQNIPTKAISLTYNNQSIESYE